MSTYDICIVGAGIVGLSTARQLQLNYPHLKILILEKESGVALHQTGRNSGVIHAGVYYPPQSLKANFCREGLKKTIDYCQEHHLPYEQCGKLIVATNTVELQRMEALYQRCLENKLDVIRLSREELQEREPDIDGCAAIYVKETGIVNYQALSEQLAKEFIESGGTLQLNAEVVQIQETATEIRLDTKKHSLRCRYLISCSGVMADRLIRMMGERPDFQIVPFRGEYYRLSPQFDARFQHLIYPVPDPSLPFLGVHLTKMIDGSVTAGPNAMLAYGRESYRKCDISPSDVLDMVRYPGFWKMLSRNLFPGVDELLHSYIRSLYLKKVQKYCPNIQLKDLKPFPSGIRAQAISRDGQLMQDFHFFETKRTLHVGNAPSPAATSAFPIGAYIMSKAAKNWLDG
ncbi:L-2-hydroxyglutarate oxidase [Algicola sagamiensis]|uniref:L-2-hydroxyglutarate oxidase n=1 Tax=Algicola sagamiensis TaxID=163869 RepID=UPI000378EDA8|nr:L-2-hydroxyglutarate oxidase [Algicola sagamiensis]